MVCFVNVHLKTHGHLLYFVGHARGLQPFCCSVSDVLSYPCGTEILTTSTVTDKDLTNEQSNFGLECFHFTCTGKALS